MIQQLTMTISRETTCYPIMIGVNVFDILSWLPKKLFSNIVIITDDIVEQLYGEQLKTAFIRMNYSCILLSILHGEQSKNNDTKQLLEQQLYQQRCDKNTLIIALGGGVIGDLAGFVAATYLRGISYIHIPSTFLAMIDSSIGGKTGINTVYGKNLLGAIYHPIAVIIDLNFLSTLSKENMINGMIEAVKIFLTLDSNAFYYLVNHHKQLLNCDSFILNTIITHAISLKMAIVMRDENDSHERNILNFGHTIGHALEKVSNYSLLHGYAVAYGILVEATIAEQKGLLSIEQLAMIKQLFLAFNIEGKHLQQFDLDKIIATTAYDKKNRQNQAYYILLNSIGDIYKINGTLMHALDEQTVRKAFAILIEG